LADNMMQELGRLLVEEAADPRLELVTVSGVRLNADLSLAEVYVTFQGGSEREAEVMAGLAKAKGFLRTRMGRVMKLRRTPDLRFLRDEYLEGMVYEPPT
jgi:ribosome-binding factor A